MRPCVLAALACEPGEQTCSVLLPDPQGHPQSAD